MHVYSMSLVFSVDTSTTLIESHNVRVLPCSVYVTFDTFCRLVSQGFILMLSYFIACRVTFQPIS